MTAADASILRCSVPSRSRRRSRISRTPWGTSVSPISKPDRHRPSSSNNRPLSRRWRNNSSVKNGLPCVSEYTRSTSSCGASLPARAVSTERTSSTVIGRGRRSTAPTSRNSGPIAVVSGRPGFQLVVAERPDDQQREARRPTSEVTQQQQRRLVGPVQVLVGEHHRSGGGRPFDELPHPVQHVPAFLLGRQVRRGWDVVVALPQRRQQLGHLRRVHPEGGTESFGRRRAGGLFEMVDRRLVGRRRLHVEAVARVDDHPEALGHRCRLARQTALARDPVAHR
jgi:hypothetical protein